MIRRLTYLLAFAPALNFAQTTLDRELPLDSLKFEAQQGETVYSRIIKNYHTVQNEYLVSDYYLTGQLEMSGKSTDRNDLIKKGLFTYYFENGNRRELVNYQNSVRLGAYFSWYENGNQKVSGEYLKNTSDESTEGLLKINQYWDKNGVQRVVDGQGFYIDDENGATSQGNIKDGLKDSIWVGSDKRLQITFSEEYNNGILVFGTSTDAAGVNFHYKTLTEEAKPMGTALQFRQGILKNLKYNQDSRFFGKSVVLSFFIEKDGYLRDVKTHLGISPEIDEKAVALLRGSAKWKPGASRGIVTRKRYFFPVNAPRLIQRQ